MIPNALLLLMNWNLLKSVTNSSFVSGLWLCYFEPINNGRKVLLINGVVIFIPLLFGVHFKQEMKENTTHALGKSVCPTVLRSRNSRPHLSPLPFVSRCFSLTKSEEKQSCSMVLQGKRRILLKNCAFTQSLCDGALQASFLPPVLHLRYDGQKKNSEWGITLKAVGNSALA